MRAWIHSVAVRLDSLLDRQPLAAVLLIAAALRLACALLLGDRISGLPGIHDEFSYDGLALRVAAGEGFVAGNNSWPATQPGAPTAHWSYLYTLYVAATYVLGGHHPLTARLSQAALAGILHPWLAWRIGRRLFDGRVGFAAASITALYGYFIYYAAALMTETFYILAILWALDLATRMNEPASERPGRWPWIALGLALGAAALLRQVVLLLVPFLLLWVWWRTERLPAGARSIGAGRGALVAVAVMALLILPWTVRNYAAFGRLVLLNTSAGYAFYWANHPIQGSSFTAILPEDGPSYAELIPPELAGLDEAALEQELLRRGVGFVAADPRRYVRLSLSRWKDYFKFWPSLHSSAASNLVRVLSFGVLLPFALVGLWRCGRDFASRLLGRRNDRGVPGRGLLCAFVAVYSLVHLLSWALVRYRLPVDAVLVIFAAVGVVATVDRLSKGRDVHEAVVASGIRG